MNNLKGEILCLKIQGIKPNFSDLARTYKMDRRTVKKYYNEEIKEKNAKKKKESKLDKYQEKIKEKLSIPGSNKKAVYEFIIENVDNDIGSYSNFRKYVQKYEDILIPKKDNVHLRFETAMGNQLQFDWKGPIKLHKKTGELEQFYIFSSTLCASRMHIFIYSKFMTSENVQRCLIETFQTLGGVPKECLTDNMSSIVNTTKREFTEEFKRFSKDMGFTAKKCKAYSPETKGKDESCNRFVNWLMPYDYEFNDETDLINIIKKVTWKVNNEINQTTNMKPIVLFEKEKEHLYPLPRQCIIDEYLNAKVTTKVSNGLLVYYKGHEYSVPKKYIGQTVKLEESGDKLLIYYNKEIIAMHDISNQRINYQEEHYIEGLQSSMPYLSDDELTKIAEKNLNELSKLTK